MQGLADTFGGKKTTWQWKNSGHRIRGILAFSSGGCSVILGVYSGSWGISQLGENLQFMVAFSVSAAYSLLIAKTDAETSHHPVHQERLNIWSMALDSSVITLALCIRILWKWLPSLDRYKVDNYSIF
ncbi:hypothetical protein PsorP6_010024 [Peronosclerospora sorghi]|uniref:Uncharacterized protein n=1 Tax=Peronosclerospora sorghi TaxID=230839 RepID=A0ACC0VVL0_9STRA|nr:hypothetical protein PsorP6_010024 [Peronosclerospora sorghi]